MRRCNPRTNGAGCSWKTMHKTAVITGAGSGVGRATALLLARNGWRCVLLGRREGTLKETVALAGKLASQLIPHVCDISDPAAVERMARFAHEQLNEVEVLVNAAGTNT